MSKTRFAPLRVARVDRLTADAVAVTFDVPAELAPDYLFAAGQHLTVRTEIGGEEIRRNYSICVPESSATLRVAVKRLDSGVFSRWANDSLHEGDVVDVLPPSGRFGLRFDALAARHYVAVAAGSGITPILSILATALETEPASRVTLVFGNRTSASVMFLEELEDLKDRYPTRVQLLHVLSREVQDVPLLTGRIDAAKVASLLATLIPPETVDEWLLCGPYAMVTDVRSALLDAGVAGDKVHTELFHVEEAPPVRTPGAPIAADVGAARVTVLLDGRTTAFDLPRDGDPAPSVLDGLLLHRRDAPYACKGGVCGTCRGKLVDGTVEMARNYALEPAELAAGFVLACQSRPTADRVTIDLDA